MVERLKLTVLVEDSVSASRRDLIAKHGLSLLVEGEAEGDKFSVLMDTGPPPDIVLHNADAIGVDLSEIDAVFLSHGHYDHTGGLIGVLECIDKKIPVIAHPKIFDAKLKLDPNLRYIGPPFKPSEVEASGGVMLLARNPVVIRKGVMTTGEIERGVAYEKVEGFWTNDGETFKEDTMLDDQALIMDVDGKGLAVVSGCAHSGIINTLRQAQKGTGVGDIYAVLGGFHLTKADNKRIRSTVKDLLKFAPAFVGPCHCTGIEAVNRLIDAFGDRCRPLRTGNTIKF